MSQNKMETNSNLKLIEILERKNIKFNVERRGEKTLFNKYSYYQVINAYKGLFVTDIENIDNIKKNIDDNNLSKIEKYKSDFKISKFTNAEDFFSSVCTCICNKYGLKGEDDIEKLKIIDKINYHHHIYDNNTAYNDFLRMYKFEHELRAILLKYILIIEESIKNIFISYLNNSNKAADYLVNMKNYNTSSFNNKAFDTMQLIIRKYNNDNSKPIKNKRRQELTIPYWILINELTMNETYNTILNINRNDSTEVFINLMNFFTKNKIEIKKNRNGDIILNEKDKKSLDTFNSILFYLGNFRNMLAHNQPIFNYNILSFSVGDVKNIEYQLPKITPSKLNHKIKSLKEIDEKLLDEGKISELKSDNEYRYLAKLEQQYKLNGHFMRNLEVFFESDDYNRKNQEANINLSTIIYILSKILNHTDKNNKFYEEITSVYEKFSLILIKSEKYIYDITPVEEFLEIADNEIDLKKSLQIIISKIENNETYKRELIKLFSHFQGQLNSIKSIKNKIKICEKEFKYKPFKEHSRYSFFTGIDKNFFRIISEK